MSDKPDALEFAQLEANIWRMKYLKAQEELKKAVEAEREACAKVCETPIDEVQDTDDDSHYVYMDGLQCAAAIRARWQE